MNDLQIFSNPEFGQVRTVEIDGQPWLVGKDVAWLWDTKILGMLSLVTLTPKIRMS